MAGINAGDDEPIYWWEECGWKDQNREQGQDEGKDWKKSRLIRHDDYENVPLLKVLWWRDVNKCLFNFNRKVNGKTNRRTKTENIMRV